MIARNPQVIPAEHLYDAPPGEDAPTRRRETGDLTSQHIVLQRGVQNASAEQLAVIEAFLAEKPALPPARPPRFDEERRA